MNSTLNNLHLLLAYRLLPLLGLVLGLMACQVQDSGSEPAVVHSELGEAGRSLYISKGCIGCHGSEGASRNPGIFPALAGKSAEYIEQQLKDFKSFERPNPMMRTVVANLNDADMLPIATYLSELPAQ